MKIKLIYGSDTGNTENIIDSILLSLLEKNGFEVEVIPVGNIDIDHWKHDKFILGIPTWYDGELQSDWEDYFPTFENLNFKNKTVALFGLGDQIGYDEWFCDGIGILAEVITKNGGQIIGFTEKDDSYEFEGSKALVDDDTFYGLALDEDNQDELTEERLEKWVDLIKEEYYINNK